MRSDTVRPRGDPDDAGMRLATVRHSTVRGTDLARVRALIVDENVTARQAMKSLLQASGIDQVQQAGDPIRAIRLMETERFGLVLCELKFRTQMDGLQVLEYVRTRRLLDPGAAFLLVSAEADRSSVAAAREWQPDGFVLKPLSAETLSPRIEQALRRRAMLAPVHAAAERGDPIAVLATAEQLAAPASERASLELTRWRVQALVDLGRYDEARALCERALEVRDDLPWAELALAHGERASGRPDAACERLRATIRAHPFHGGAYDLLIEILQAQGRTAKALAVARAALEQIATSRRTRTLGELAYAHGELELAEKCYADLIRKTSASLTKSALDVGMLGQVFVGQGESDKALRLVANADVDMAGDAPSQALAASVQAQAHAAMGDVPASRSAARRALAFASMAPPPESVALLVARGAFSGGLRGEAEALIQKTIATRARAGGPGALARKVLGDAGIEPEAFAARAASAGAGAPVVDQVVDPQAAARASAEEAERGAHVRARPAGAGDADDAAADDDASARAARDAGDDAAARPAPSGEPATAAANVERALSALHLARFDDAVMHIEHARAQLPSNPMVLMATVQVYLLQMRARGFDAVAAAEVRRCLAELDSQIPGDARVFAGLDGAPLAAGTSSAGR